MPVADAGSPSRSEAITLAVMSAFIFTTTDGHILMCLDATGIPTAVPGVPVHRTLRAARRELRSYLIRVAFAD